MSAIALSERVEPFMAMLESTFEGTVPARLNVSQAVTEVAANLFGPHSQFEHASKPSRNA